LPCFVLPREALGQWLASLANRFNVFVPQVIGNRSHWHRYVLEGETAGPDGVWAGLKSIRAAEPVKSFLFQPRHRVGSFPDRLEPVEMRPQVLFGMKNCDLVPLTVHDRILGQGEFNDPFYTTRRQATYTVVADCPAPEESCFCNLLGYSPWAEKSADVALSEIEGGLFLEVEDKGRELVAVSPGLFREVRDGDASLSKRAQARQAAADALKRTNPVPLKEKLAEAALAKERDLGFWTKHAQSCVECFGCLMGCPTCYCFLLYDQARDKGFDRTRTWDACYLAAYARVGGGANPRVEFAKRFANRFICKFHDFKTDHGMFSCSGCGRCFRACMGKIDLRKVLAEL
jgi:ferredoxin